MKWLLTLAGFILIGSSAFAQTVILTEEANNLYDTGLAANGTALATGSVDPHYSLIENPSDTGTSAYVTTLATGWTANVTGPPPAQWISFDNDAGTGETATYEYQLVLTIPTGQLVTISGDVAADDQVEIEANGVVEYTGTAPAYGSSTAFSFTFDSSTTSTNDDLDFLVDNSGGGPTGLLVSDLAGSYTPVPEMKDTAVLYIVFAGLLVLTARTRRVLS